MSLLLSPASVLAVSPILLELLKRLLEKAFSFVLRDAMAQMREDSRKAVQDIGNSEALRDAVRTYVTYGTRIQQVFQTAFIALLSLIISQYTCTNSIYVLGPFHMTLLVLLVVFIVWVLAQLWRRRVDPAAVGSTDRYYYTALLFNFLVIALDRVRLAVPQICAGP